MAWPSAAQATALRVPASTRPASLNVLRAGQPVRLRDAHVGQRDLGLPHRAQRPLALDRVARRSPGVPFSTRNPLTWPSATSRAQTTTTSAIVPLPIHFFAPLMTQSSPSRRAEVSSATESEPCSGSVSANAPSLSSRAIGGSHRCFCSSRAEHRDRLHRQAGLHPEEGAQAAVAAVELHVHQPGRDRAHRRAAVPLDAVADDAELGQLLDQRPGELGPLPVAVDDRQHLVVDEVAGAPPVVALLAGELVGDAEVVGAQRPADVLVHGVLLSAVEDVGAGRVDQRLAGRAPPSRLGAGFSGPQRSAEPGRRVRPPAALHGLRAGEPRPAGRPGSRALTR